MKRILITGLALLITGCATSPNKDVGRDESPEELFELMALPMPNVAPQEVSHGSLYNASYNISLYEDRMAYMVGDILTVILDESTKSSTTSGTDFRKDNSVGLSTPNIFGRSVDGLDMGMDRQFKGGGSSSQQGMLDGSITVSVLKVLPNRTLLVRGEKWLTLNQGDEYIRVSGLLRPEDIMQDNTVSSQRLANARLVYSGEGPIAEANEAGWLMRFFNSPVMPM